MKKKTYVDIGADLSKSILSALNPKYQTDEIKVHRVGKFHSSTFNIWKKESPDLKMETTISKRSISELVDAIVKYIS